MFIPLKERKTVIRLLIAFLEGGNILCAVQLLALLSLFFVSSRVMNFSSHAHFWKVFCGFSLSYQAED